MKTSFELPNEYPNSNFTLYKELAVTESIAANCDLFKTISISHDDKGNTIEKKPMIFVALDLKNKNQHKLKSCIALNNDEHKRAWNMYFAFNRSIYSNKTESGNNMIQYLDSVLLLFESWFYEHGLHKELNIKRLIHNRNFTTVRKGETEFVLTGQQSLVIRYLYELTIQGIPSTTPSDVISYIEDQQGIQTSGKKIAQIFRNNSDARKALIISNSKTIKLNID